MNMLVINKLTENKYRFLGKIIVNKYINKENNIWAKLRYIYIYILEEIILLFINYLDRYWD